MQTTTHRRRQATPAQQAKAQEKRAKVREFARIIGAMSEAERTEFMLRVGGVTTAEGRRLSFFNTALLLHQLPGASQVGGYRQWQAAGRQVRKGESALMMWCPAGNGEKDAPSQGEAEDEKRFFLVSVFDISQTDPMENN